MKTPTDSRRTFLRRSTVGAAVASFTTVSGTSFSAADGTPAILGGTPVCSVNWPQWPVTDSSEEAAILKVVRHGDWYRYNARGTEVQTFEKLWAEAVGAAHCLAVANGTSALLASLAALGIGPGDEVLVPPYTFIATVNCVLMLHALPVFVDSDPSTAMMDAEKVAARINGNTRVIIPVHIGGAPCHMDKILEIAKKHNLKVIEDACQAHTGEWKGRRVGSIGDMGCFSFQNSKNLNCGEGGAITTNNAALKSRAEAFHCNGRDSNDDGLYTTGGGNFRLTQFQGAILVEQLKRLEEQSKQREQNGAYLNQLLKDVPGVRPKQLYPGATRHGYHLYILDYDAREFAGISKSRFMEAVKAEGIPLGGGYKPLNREPFLERCLDAPGFKRIYSAQRLAQWREENHLPENDRMCGNTFWFGQTTLLAGRDAMEQIAQAFLKIRKHASKLA